MSTFASRFVDAEGLALHVLERPGPGPRVLCLHGWLDNAHTFDFLAEHFPREWHLALLEFRGMGRSAHIGPGAQYAYGDHLLDVEWALDGLGWDRAHIVGHSLGGVVTIDYAAARPERVRSVTLIEVLGPRGGAPEKVVERVREAVAFSKRAPHRKVHASAEAAAKRLQESNPGLPDAAALHLARFGTEPVEGGVAFTFDPRHRRRFAITPDEDQVMALLRAVQAPARLIVGTHGMPMPPEQKAARLAALRADGPHPVEGGHHVHMERPAEVARLVAEWIGAHSEDSGAR